MIKRREKNLSDQLSAIKVKIRDPTLTNRDPEVSLTKKIKVINQ